MKKVSACVLHCDHPSCASPLIFKGKEFVVDEGGRILCMECAVKDNETVAAPV